MTQRFVKFSFPNCETDILNFSICRKPLVGNLILMISGSAQMQPVTDLSF